MPKGDGIKTVGRAVKHKKGFDDALILDDLIAVCKKLNEAGARYILIGGFAVNYYGFPQATEDIDLFTLRRILKDLNNKDIKKIGHNETPLIINLGKDNSIYSLR